MTISELAAHLPNVKVPTLRGRFHQVSLFVSVPAGLVLVLLASGLEAKVAATVYAASLTGLFAASTVYHRWTRTPRAKQFARRLDHSMIFVLIAGTYTPLCLIALPPAWGVPLLIGVWSAAVVGIVLKFVRLGPDGRAGNILYIVIGWVALIAMPKLITDLGPLTMALILTGGLLYTVGAVVLARRRPDPVPTVFGYHEVWHVFVVIAVACHFAAIAQVTSAA